MGGGCVGEGSASRPSRTVLSAATDSRGCGGAREAAPHQACYVSEAEAGVGTTRTRWEGDGGVVGGGGAGICPPAPRLCPAPQATHSGVPGCFWLPVSGDGLVGVTPQRSGFCCKPGTSPPTPHEAGSPHPEDRQRGGGSTWHRTPSPRSALPASAGASAGSQGGGTGSVALCPPCHPSPGYGEHVLETRVTQAREESAVLSAASRGSLEQRPPQTRGPPPRPGPARW